MLENEPKKKQSPSTQENYSTAEAAGYLGLAEQTLANWRHLRRGPAYVKLGRRIVYPKVLLKAYMDQNLIRPSMERGSAYDG